MDVNKSEYVNERYDSKFTGCGFYTVPAIAFRGFVIKCPYKNLEAEAHQFGPLQGPPLFILTVHLHGLNYDPVLEVDGTYKTFSSLDEIKEFLANSKYGQRKIQQNAQKQNPIRKTRTIRNNVVVSIKRDRMQTATV